ncbi:MAG: gliding motility-associated C-terminal domain-containing protein [Brumimicrobium sp.]
MDIQPLGNLVFHSENYQNDWNGTSQSSFNIGGSKLPEGTYYYVIKLGGDLILEEDNSVKTGFVVLRR